MRDFLLFDRCFFPSPYLDRLLWLAFHVAGGLIHILLVLAVISAIVHFIRRA